MGHLINPIAMRIGWFSYWENFWFVDFVYYSEFLYALLKIKSFLIYLLSFRFVELYGFLYSHLIIINKLKLFIIKIYLYPGILEDMAYDMHDDIMNFAFIEERHSLYKMFRGKLYWTLGLRRIYYLFIIFRFFFYFSFESICKDVDFVKFLNLISSLNFFEVKKFFLNSKNDLSARSKFVFFYLVLVKLREQFNLFNIKFNSVILYFARSLILFKCYHNVLHKLSGALPIFLIKTFLNYDFDVKLTYIFINNLQVNANFLARYFGRKFQQGYRLRSLANQIKRELHRVARLLNPGKVSAEIDFLKREEEMYFEISNSIKYFSLKSVNYLIKIYRLELLKFYLINHCWLNFNFFILGYWISINFNIVEELIGISIFYLKVSCYFALFFSNNYFFLNDFWNLNFDYNVKMFLEPIKFGYTCIYVFLYTFNLVVLRFLDFMNNEILLFLKISLYYLNNILSYNFWVRNYIIKNNIYIDFSGKHKKRTLFFSDIVGFKFQFKGRFSRKQRAAKSTFTVGNTSLTKLTSKVEYGFYTIPLRNSAVSIKIWLHKNLAIKEILV